MPFNRRNSAARPTSIPNTRTSASAGERARGRAGEGRAHDQKFTGENSERRQTGDRDNAEDQRPAEDRMGLGETADIGDTLRAFDLGDMADREKDCPFGRDMT